MKTKIATIITLATLIAGNAYAQIYTMGDEANLRDETIEEYGAVPAFGLTDDQDIQEFTPLGNGVLLLAALGGAYLMGTRKKKKSK